MKKLIEIFKKKWLKNSIFTAILVIVLIAIFVLINLYVQSLDIKPIDLSKEKLYTLSEESINLVKNINNDVNIYFFGYSGDETVILLAKQYKEANEKINAEAIDINLRQDLAKKYGVESNDSTGIIVESSEKSKVLTSSDFYTYDTETYKQIDVTEQKLTNAILDTSAENKPSIYFLTGHEEYGITDYLMTLGVYTQNDVNNVSSLDLLQSEIPNDCDVIVIANPQKDFADIETNRLQTYIDNGGKIIWLGEATIDDANTPNINKILEQFGVSFSKGIIMEENPNKVILQNPTLILPDISYHKITQDLTRLIFACPGKLNIESDEKLEQLNVTVNKLISSSEESFYRENFDLQTASKSQDEENGPYTLGAEFIKKIEDNKNATLIIFSNTRFITDAKITSSSNVGFVNLYENKDIVLNTIAYLTNKGDTIRVRKTTEAVMYTATQSEDYIVKLIIFSFPIIIVITGVIVWQTRRRKK